MQKNNKLTFLETLTMAAGFTIGSGIITQTGVAIGMTGRSVPLAFLASATLFLISFRPLFIMTTVLPRRSAAYHYSKELIGEEIGGLYVYIYFLGRMTIAIFGISFAQYAASLFPALSGVITQRIIAVLTVTLFFLTNLKGMKSAAKLQNILFFILIAGLLSFVAFGIGDIEPNYYEASTFFSGGALGFYRACSLLFFAVGGAYIITDFAPSIDNCKKVMIKVIVIVTLSVCVIYMLMGIVASGVVPVSDAMYKPLTVAAQKIFTNKGMYAFFIIAACLGALLTTLNSSFVWYSNSLMSACEEGWLPKGLAKTNKAGIPYRLMIIFYLFGIIPAIFGIDLTVLSKMAIGLTIFAICIPMAGLLKLPEKYPEEWENSKYAAKFPKWRRIAAVVISYAVLSTQVVSLFTSNPPAANIIIVVYILGVSVFLLVRYIKRKNNL